MCLNFATNLSISLEEAFIKETEQIQLTWHSHIQRMAKGRLPKIALKWTPKQEDRRNA
jgi:hypothetical protein